MQKYYEGLTTREEENKLFQWMESSSIPEEELWDTLPVEAMNALHQEEIDIPEDLNDHILKGLADFQAPLKQRSLRSLYWISSAAAVVLIFMSSLLFLRSSKNDLGTFSDPQLAYNETQEALDLVAMYFGKGTEQLKLVEKFDEGMKPLESLGEVDKVNKELQHLTKLNPGIDAAMKLLNGK